jgi:putative transposase
VRKDAGQHPSLSSALREVLRLQYHKHKSWSAQLHVDNLAALVAKDPLLGPMPSYQSVRRFLKAQGLHRQRTPRHADRPGAERAAQRREELEVRSYEATHTHGLWHADFHHGSRKVLTAHGTWEIPLLLGVLDDHSRLACHLQWYLDETTESFVHGLSQAIQKRGLPRAFMTDNGSAMRAAETVEGLSRLGIVHERTLEYSPYQNAKQEVFWAQVEGRLMAMLEGVENLTLELLNESTQAWVELDYHRNKHSELGVSPLERYLKAPTVGRPSPTSDELRRSFRAEVVRTQRRSDGTLSLMARRFEVPARYCHLQRLHVRYASWDLSTVDLADPRSGQVLCPLYPLDKARNADGQRRRISPDQPSLTTHELPPPSGMAPLLRQLLADYAATGLPPAYLPHPVETKEENE